VKCAKCHKEISHIATSVFAYDGSDYDDTIGIEEDEHFNAVIMETDQNWTGYELTEDEMRERIECPYCHQFPFGSNEIQVYDVVRIVCFKTDMDIDQIVLDEITKRSDNNGE
jgi:DNA-directed RNA polymerase subunit RPC12/RpoP